MPEFAIYNNQIITSVDIYKFNIEKAGPFYCFNCDKEVSFRQSRNGTNNYTEHFYHPNTTKDTHIECEKVTLESVRDINTWHNTLSSFIEQENREVVRRIDGVKHIVDAYDSLNNMGVEFQNSKISVEDIQSRDNTTNLDWIFNVEKQFIRRVEIGNKILCEIPHDNWERAVKAVKNSVFLYTGYNEWIYLNDRENYHVEVDSIKRNVWIGSPCTFQDVMEGTCLQNMITEAGRDSLSSNIKQIITVKIIYARCKKSMYLLDKIHRHYIKNYMFQDNDIIAIKSVAGSGKTTTLLNLAKKHSNKKILYLAYNRSLITEIEIKKHKEKITNIHPLTFDALLNSLYKDINDEDPTYFSLRPQTIGDIIPWLKNKEFKIRKYYVDEYNKFCNDHVSLSMKDYCLHKFGQEKPLLIQLWNESLSDKLLTFESIRKIAFIKKWFKSVIDSKYDMIMIDETQDFDMIMLKMLLNDTTIPKIFVGDPKQSIYQFRGCINAFNYLPKSSLIVEFYSTFRTGDPACEEIRSKFTDCWMISKSKNNTIIETSHNIKESKYTYLFRSWRHLLTTAQTMKKLWIRGFESQMETMRNLHLKLKRYGAVIDNDSFEDDLPSFLKSISQYELDKLISDVENNLVAKEDAQCKMYTVHAFKGLEDDVVRIANDIDINSDINIYYVAVTRGMKKVIFD